MKKFLVISFGLLAFNIASAQEGNARGDSTIAKSELIKQYEVEIQQIEKMIDQEVYQIAINDPIIRQRLNQLLENSTRYAQLAAMLNLRQKDLKKVKGDNEEKKK